MRVRERECVCVCERERERERVWEWKQKNCQLKSDPRPKGGTSYVTRKLRRVPDNETQSSQSYQRISIKRVYRLTQSLFHLTKLSQYLRSLMLNSIIFIKRLKNNRKLLFGCSDLQAGLVIRRLFIFEFDYSHFKISQKWQFSGQKWTFYLRIKMVQKGGTYFIRIMSETCNF